MNTTFKNIISWILRLIAAIIMLQTLTFKFGGAPESVYIFTKAGIEPWGRYGSGVAELIASILLLIPRYYWLGALLGSGVMAGAIFTHLTILGIEVMEDDGLLFFLALTVFACCTVLLWFERKTISQLPFSIRQYIKKLFIIAVLGCSYFNLNAQGCSDAGFCTAGGLKNESTGLQSSDIRLGYNFNIGEQNVLIQAIQLETNFKLQKKAIIQAKIPFLWIQGNLGNTKGFGDPMISITYQIQNKKQFNAHIIGGIKFPLGKTNFTYQVYPQVDNYLLSLPMPYQTGLGTTDLIAGYRINKGAWKFATGLQWVLIQNNKNNFLPEKDTLNDGLYFASNQLKRGNDLLLRVEHNIKIGNFNIEPGLLGIYRLKGDIITESNGNSLLLQGSKGTTLNLTLNVNFKISAKLQTALNAGAPIIVRQIRADGLTRAFVTSVQFKYLLN